MTTQIRHELRIIKSGAHKGLYVGVKKGHMAAPLSKGQNVYDFEEFYNAVFIVNETKFFTLNRDGDLALVKHNKFLDFDVEIEDSALNDNQRAAIYRLTHTL